MEEQNQSNNKILEELQNIRKAVVYLGEQIDKQEKRISSLEQSAEKLHSSSPYTQPKTDIATPPPPPPLIPPIIDKKTENIINSSHIELKTESSNLEENIGGKWFARIGVVALVLGISFFLKYAFDNGWIGPMGRVAIGIVSGIILLGIGERYIRKYSVYGQIITGGGIAILYLSIFAGYSFYVPRVIPLIPAYAMMIIITAAGIALSIRYNAISIIIISILGGFLTPFLINTGQNNQIGLFSYIAILDLAVLAVSIFKKWRALTLVGMVGTVITFSAWAGTFYRKEALLPTMLFLTLFFVIFSIASLIYNLVKKENSSGVEQTQTIFSAALFFGASYALLDPDYHIFMGFFTLILAIYYFLWAYLVKAVTPTDKNLYSFLALLTIGFLTLAIPIQFDGRIITIGWTIEAILLFLIGIKTQGKEVKSLALVIFSLALIRLLFVDSGYEKDAVNIANQTFFTFLMVILSSYLLAFIFKRFGDEADKFMKSKDIIVLFVIVANFLTIFIGSREISFFYDSKLNVIEEERSRRTENMRAIYGNNYYSNPQYQSAQKEYYEKRNKIRNASSTTLSIFWLIYGIILMMVGIFGKYKGVRIGGIILFMLAILKLFFYDLWSLGTLYRIISSISLGVVLLSISFAYQKYKDKIKEII